MTAIEQPAPRTADDGLSRWRTRRILRNHASAYATAHLLPSPSIPLKVKEWPGLLGYVTVARSHPQSDLILAYWNTRDDYERHEKGFQAVAGPIAFEGLLRGASESVLARAGRFVSYSTVLLTLIAILGALQSLSLYGDWLFLYPTLHLKTERQRLQYIAGLPFAETVHVANRTAMAHRNVAIKSARLATPTGETLADVEAPSSTFERLLPNTSESVQLQGIAPVKAGKYLLRFDVAAAAGHFRGHPDKVFSKDVEVWAAKPVVSLRRVAAAANHVEFAGEVAIGLSAPNGLDCNCIVSRSAGTRQVTVDYPHTHKTNTLPRNATPGAEMVGVRWHTARGEGFRRVPFRVVVTGSPDQIFDENIKVNCYASP